MKRLFCLGMGVFFIFIMSIPAWAAVDIGGQIFFDSYFYHQDKQGYGRAGYTAMKTQPGSGGYGGIPVGGTTTAEDRNQTYFDLNHATALRFNWTSEKGIGFNSVFFMNTDPAQSVGTDSGFKVGVSIAVLYYDITKDFRLAVGRGGYTEVFSPYNPTTYMGYDGVCKVEGLGYGNINSKYQDMIRFTYTLGPMAKLDLGFAMPRLTADLDSTLTATTGNAINNVSTIPKIEFGVPLTFGGSWGNVSITPSAMFLRQQFNNVASGDDSITSYGLSVGGSYSLGGLKLMGEYNYGQNLYNAARTGEATSYPFKYELITGGLRGVMTAKALNGKLYDSKTNAFWVQLGYTIAGRVSPTVFYGRDNAKRDMPSGDSDWTTQMYGVNVPITITKNFSIAPEVMIYDNGSSNKINGTTYDFGKEWLAGVEFRLFF